MTDRKKAYIAAIVYAFIIGLSFMFVKVTLTAASPLDTLAHRFTAAWIGATVMLVFNKSRLAIGWKDVLNILPLALLYPIAFFALQVFGLANTSSSEAGIIQATVPIFTLLLAALFLKERASRSQLIFIGLSVLGIVYILVMNGAGTGTGIGSGTGTGTGAGTQMGSTLIHMLGNGLILLSAVAFALYNVFARRLTRLYSLMTLSYVMTLSGFVAFNGMAIGQHVIQGTLRQYFEPFGHLGFVMAILYLGILSSLVTSYLSNYTLSKIKASEMSVFSNVATLITILAGVLFLQEEFHYYHLVGAAFIITGVIGTNFYRVKKETEPLSIK